MRARLTLIGAFCILTQMGICGARADESLEYAVKAAYLTKFIPFITWPDAALPAPNSPVAVCVLGDDPFGGKLEQAAASAKFGEHPVTVKKLASPDATCQIAFLGTGAEAALDALRGKPVVTVTDSSQKIHGVFSFVLVENHVRFDVDDALAAQDGLQISSKLLSLAHAVKPRSAP
jgi:hypothetical protein